MLKVPRFIVNSDLNSSSITGSRFSELNLSDSELNNNLNLKNNSESAFLNSNEFPSFDLNFSTFVITDQEPKSDEAELVSKICKSINRDNYNLSNLSDPNSSDLFGLVNLISSLGISLSFQDYKNYLTSIKGFSGFKVLICFSNEAISTEVTISDKVFEEIKILKIMTYGLKDISTNPNYKSEFWNFIKELKNVPSSLL
jgi:hypothetical protein